MAGIAAIIGFCAISIALGILAGGAIRLAVMTLEMIGCGEDETDEDDA